MGPFNVLIGPNASGKSNFLDVLLFIKDMITSEDGVMGAVRRRAPDFSHLVWMMEDVGEGFEFVVEYELPEEYRVRTKDKRGKERLYDRIKYMLKVGTGEYGPAPVREHLYLVDSSSVNDPLPKRDPFPYPPPDRPLIDTTKKKVRTPVGHRIVARRLKYGPRVYMRSERGSRPFNITLSINPLKSVLSVLLEDERRFRTSLWFRNVLKNSLLFVHLNVERMRRPTPPSAPITFQPDGSNLPTVLLDLKENHPQRFLWYVSHVSSALKDVEDIEIQRRPEDNFLYVVLRYRYGLKAPSWVLSDGTLRFLALSVIPFLPPQSRIFLIEEPENGIHPRAVSSLLEVLKGPSDNQIFVATHSPLILRQMQPKDILVFRKTEDGATDIVRGTEHPALRRWREEVPLDKLVVSGIL